MFLIYFYTYKTPSSHLTAGPTHSADIFHISTWLFFSVVNKSSVERTVIYFLLFTQWLFSIHLQWLLCSIVTVINHLSFIYYITLAKYIQFKGHSFLLFSCICRLLCSCTSDKVWLGNQIMQHNHQFSGTHTPLSGDAA